LSPSDGSTLASGASELRWNPVRGTVGLLEYRIQISADNTFTSPVIDEIFSIGPFPFELSAGTYYWRVKAKDIYGNEGAWSEVWIFAVATAAPSAPTNVSATAGDGQVTLSWNTVSGATRYNIYWSTSQGVTKMTGTKISNISRPYAHTGLTNGTTYYYVVTAENSYGESDESSEVSAKPAKAFWASVAAGDAHTVALKTDSTLYAWGYNTYGQLGDGTTVDKDTPTRIGSD
jgi:hypothetical protein